MHVLLLPSWYPSTAYEVNGVFFRDQALALYSQGYKVGVVAPILRSLRTIGNHVALSRYVRFEIDEGIPTYRMRRWALPLKVPFANYWIWRRAANRILKRYLAEQGIPDIIHAHSAIYAGAVAVEWGARLGVPVVLTEHSSAYARRIVKPWQLRLARRTAALVDSKIVVSPSLGKLIEEQMGESLGRWQWIPNVVAPRFFEDAQYGGSNRGTRSSRLLNLALMTENKGQSDLLKAFAQAFPGPSRVELWLAGDGPIRGQLEEKAKSLEISERVRFLGMVPPQEVPALLRTVDIMVVASHYETFGVVAAEALMVGVPVVATRCGGPEYIVGPDDGILVPPRDPVRLAEALKVTVEKLGSYNKKKIKSRAWSRFSPPAIVNQLGKIYQQVLAEHRS